MAIAFHFCAPGSNRKWNWSIWPRRLEFNCVFDSMRSTVHELFVAMEGVSYIIKALNANYSPLKMTKCKCNWNICAINRIFNCVCNWIRCNHLNKECINCICTWPFKQKRRIRFWNGNDHLEKFEIFATTIDVFCFLFDIN